MADSRYKLVSFGIHRCAPEWEWRTKGFGDYDLWAVFGGEGSLFLNGVEHRVSAGSCVLIPPDTEIYGTHNADNRLVVYNVHFEFVNGKKEERPYGAEMRRIRDVAFFRNLFERAVGFGNMNRTDLACSCIDLLLSEFFASPREDREGQSPAETAHVRCVSEICARINEFSEARLSLSELAQEYGYSATYLGKLFHKIVGVGFSDYLANAKVNRAKILLADTEMPIAEIAQKLGYYDPCHFVKQFKKHTGYTPKSMR